MALPSFQGRQGECIGEDAGARDLSVCLALGLVLGGSRREGAGAPRRRDPEFRRTILMAYEYRCAFCGFDGLLDGSMVGLEAAHVRWWTHGGPNEAGNGLCLCSIHHKLLDKGVLGVTGQHTITVSARFVGRSPAAERRRLPAGSCSAMRGWGITDNS